MPTFDITAPDGTHYEVTGPEGSTEAQALERVRAQHATPEASFGSKVAQQARNLSGALRGAGSIGATLLAPVDAAARAVGIQNDFIGRTDRRQAMDDAMQSMGADPDSLVYKGSKLLTEIAGTAGAGGAVAGTIARVAPRVAAAAPNLLSAIGSAGMNAGSATGATNALLRIGGGAIAGGASAGLVNPADAGAGAIVGGALPAVAQVFGKAGSAIGSTLRGPAQSPELAGAIKSARDAGYVIPPSQASPTLANRLMEGVSGKITMAQNASARNQGVTNKLAAEAIGLPADTKLTADVLEQVRSSAGQAYQAVAGSGTVTPAASYGQALDNIAAPFLKASQGFPNSKPSPVIELVDSLRSPSFDAAAAVEKIKSLRTAADDAFRTGNTDIARASKSAAAALENALEDHLQSIGAPDVLGQFRDARKLIAKTYSVQKALNAETGTVDARKLAAQLQRGKPLSGELRDAAGFAARFPKAAQAVEGMGSLPQTSPLDLAAGAGLSAATGNPLAMLTMAARPATRAAILSPLVQNRLVQGAPPTNRLLSDPRLAQFAFQAAPVIGADR